MLSDKKSIKVQSSPVPKTHEFDNIEDQNEDFENDIYLIELHKRLTNMKKERKKAESDAQLLDNRLKLLKGEEEKTWKKIEVTKKKTQEKIINLEQYEENMRQKQELIEAKNLNLEIKKEFNKNFKNQIKSNIEKKREEKVRQVMMEAELLKRQKENNRDLLKKIEEEEKTSKKNVCEFIKTQEMIQQEKKKAQELERINRLKNELELKIFEEQSLREKAENKLVNLEQEEIEIMKRIRTTTQVHKAMVDDFEKISINNIKNQGSDNNTPVKEALLSNGFSSSGKKK